MFIINSLAMLQICVTLLSSTQTNICSRNGGFHFYKISKLFHNFFFRRREVAVVIDRMWDQIEPTPTHLTYMILSSFLILYALFSQFIRNSLHLSEPPLAVLSGIIFGPAMLNIITPRI